MSTMAPSHDTDFTYLHHTTFAPDPQSLTHLTHVCVFLDNNPPGIYGLQFHFDDRDPIPALSPFPGKGVSFMINGILGETICAAHTFYSERSQSAGVTVIVPKCLLVYDTLYLANRCRSLQVMVDERTFRLQISPMMGHWKSMLLTSIAMLRLLLQE